METEFKIEVADLEAVRARLREAGATLVETSDEENVYLDRSGGLERRHEILRVRRDARVRVTWKGPTDFQGGVRNRPEIEVEVSSFDDAIEIFERLGFQPIERLAKHRETWRLAGVEVALDTLAFGQFVELEGGDAAIRWVASLLGLDVAAGLRQSYRELRRLRSG
jgi:predicted adenylyl cyclase CyaB